MIIPQIIKQQKLSFLDNLFYNTEKNTFLMSNVFPSAHTCNNTGGKSRYFTFHIFDLLLSLHFNQKLPEFFCHVTVGHSLVTNGFMVASRSEKKIVFYMICLE